ncbi:ribosome silencing factor [Roseobacter sp. WL0113]|uniref:Ribosomal silencing factor RsfS n=2 Tax=Roseobacter sinensis TaxID=2931391 RepID=A0ABT3BL42_9RHOB|nr:ribosome silencing factor [Roseobacter sp. WL0113]
MSHLSCYPFRYPSAGALTARHKEDNVLSIHTDAADAAQNGSAVMVTATDMATSEALLATILSSLTDDKAEDIVQIDLRGKTEIGDYMVICSGRSTRQVSSISEKLAQTVKDDFGLTAKVEGKETGDWVLIDTGDVIVHVFRPEVREFYQLEKMWQPMSGSESAAN